jgi:hypothetical protein
MPCIDDSLACTAAWTAALAIQAVQQLGWVIVPGLLLLAAILLSPARK